MASILKNLIYITTLFKLRSRVNSDFLGNTNNRLNMEHVSLLLIMMLCISSSVQSFYVILYQKLCSIYIQLRWIRTNMFLNNPSGVDSLVNFLCPVVIRTYK